MMWANDKIKGRVLWTAAVLSALILVGNGACRQHPSGKEKEAAESASPRGSSDSASRDSEAQQWRYLTLLYTTGVSGEVTDCGCPGHPRGGLARRALWVEGLRQAQPASVVYVDAGNMFFPLSGVPLSEQDKVQAQLLARSMPRLKAAAINVGLQDLRAGVDFLKKELGESQTDSPLPLISANLSDENRQLLFPPAVIVEEMDIRLGIFGLTEAGELPDQQVTVRDPAETARQMAAKLRTECDLVVGLYAMSFPTATRLAGEAPGVDIIIVSDRSGTVKSNPLPVGNSLLFQAGNRGMFLGRLDLSLPPQRGSELSAEETARLKNELARLSAQQLILEGAVRDDRAVNKEYVKTVKKRAEIEEQLMAGSKFQYEHTIISIEPTLAEDEVIASWVKEAGIQPRTEQTE